MNKYKLSDGSSVSEATIKSKLSALYKRVYAGQSVVRCEGCGRQAQGSAHIIPKARCKVLHRTEWIWAEWNIFPACHVCNLKAESTGREIFTLLNVDRVIETIKQYDNERYHKICG